MSASSRLVVDRDSRGVCTLTLNRPDKRNAFDGPLIADLHSALTQAAHDSAVRIVVLTGVGSAFCAGMDLDHMRRQGTLSASENIDDALKFAHCLDALDRCPKPTIARINGSAYGGGLGLIACADIAIGVDSAKFALTEVRLGIVPAVISPYVVAAIGARQSRRWFLSGGPISADLAEQIGLLHEVVMPDQLDAAVHAEVELLLRGGPAAQRAAKQLVRDVSVPDDTTHRHTAELLAELRASSEGQEGLRAFNEKRAPDWRS